MAKKTTTTTTTAPAPVPAVDTTFLDAAKGYFASVDSATRAGSTVADAARAIVGENGGTEQTREHLRMLVQNAGIAALAGINDPEEKRTRFMRVRNFGQCAIRALPEGWRFSWDTKNGVVVTLKAPAPETVTDKSADAVAKINKLLGEVKPLASNLATMEAWLAAFRARVLAAEGK